MGQLERREPEEKMGGVVLLLPAADGTTFGLGISRGFDFDLMVKVVLSASGIATGGAGAKTLRP